MSKFYKRMKGKIQRNLYSRQNYYDPETWNEEGTDSPDRLDENESDNINDVQINESLSPKTPLQGQAGGRVPLDNSPPAAPVNPPNLEVRTVPDVIQPTTNVNPPVNTNTIPIPAPTGLPNPDPSAHPPANPIQPLLPSINQVPQSSLRGGPPSIKNRKRRPFVINPNSQLVGFPRSRHFQPASFARPTFNPRQQTRPSFPTRPPRPPVNISNLEIDYPIENVFINENIPSSIAMKINETVEHDRFGNTYNTHRYAYKPKTQYISIGNNQHWECRLVENDHQMGVRYIREINYPQKQNLNNAQIIIDNSPQLNCFPTPIHHFTAHALPNDPMRYY